MESLFLTAILAVAIFTLLVQPSSTNAAKETYGASPVVPAVIVFGDSIVDPGNNNNLVTLIKSNFPPLWQDFMGGKATGRFSNGKLTTDFIASKLGVKELLPAYMEAGLQDLLTGVSFASSNSGYDNLTSQLTSVISMAKQLEMFKEYKEKLRSMAGEKKAASIVNDSLYIVSSGSNDVFIYGSTPLRKAQYNISAYADFLTKAASDFVKELVGVGARNIAVWGIPPVGCVPLERTLRGGTKRDCVQDNNKLARVYNSKIVRELQRLNSSLQGAKLIYIDVYDTLLDLIQHPKKHDFVETTKGCCGTGYLEAAVFCNIFSTTCKNVSSYIFWDSVHPTERANKIIVDKLIGKYIGFIS